MKYELNPEDFNFHPSSLYPELGDFFGPNTYVKAIAGGDKLPHYWYVAIKFNNSSVFPDDRVKIYSGSFTKGKVIEQNAWPKLDYLGLISSNSFAIDLLSHLLGTLTIDSVHTTGRERVFARCLYNR